MDNSLQAHFPILIQLLVGAAVPVLILVAGYLFGQRVRKKARASPKDEPYECGITGDSDASVSQHPRFTVKFHVTALLFVLFNLEVLFLFPWALSFRELAACQANVALPSAVFIGLFAFGLFYQIKKCAHEWKPQALNHAPRCK